MWAAGLVGFPVGGCGGRALVRTNLHIHFVHRPVRYMEVIMEEVNHPHPRLPACDVFVL